MTSLAVKEHVSLKSFNTLAIEAHCRYFIAITDSSQLPDAVNFAKEKQLDTLILGGGSNIVLAGDFPGVVIHIDTTGITADQQGDSVLLEVAAGENWHQLVLWSLSQEYFGLENLALIPGTVGAAPIQNIGAYGVELESMVEAVTGWHCELKAVQTLTREQCQFGYRDSIFKHSLKDKFVITSVTLRLQLTPAVKLDYKALADFLAGKELLAPAPSQVAEAVIAIRQSRLPDPESIPNVGSFFKNPMVSPEKFESLQSQFPDIAHYIQADGRIKLAAAWLVEQAGWKGRVEGRVGVHQQQSIVLVNHNKGTGKEILGLAGLIQQSVAARYGVELEIEPRVY